MSQKVEFLIAGVQKGGTTALCDYLRLHPGLRMSDDKEPHVFDDEGQNWAAPDFGPYHAQFGGATDRLWGEATPIYSYWPPAMARIARYNPAMRLVLLFRDPVDRAWSHWRMETRRGWEREPFAWCIREGRARVDDAAAPGAHRVFSYVERGFYHEQLAGVVELFPPAQVLCLRSEDLKTHPRAVLDRVCGHLRVAPFETPPAPHERNVGEGPDAPSPEDRAYLSALYRDGLERFAALSGLDVQPWLSRA